MARNHDDLGRDSLPLERFEGFEPVDAWQPNIQENEFKRVAFQQG